MLISAIVVNWNQRQHTLNCIDSLVAALGEIEGQSEILIVDNGSTDGSNDALRERFPQVRIVERGRNTGFTPALAEGLRRTSGEWILLVNNDATIERDGVRRMLEVGEGDPSAGAVAATIIFADGSDRINSAGILVDRLGVGHDRLMGRPAATREKRPIEVHGACGGGALLRRAMLDDIGGVDESFFIYLEDVDLAWRARASGWRAMYVPDAIVHHHHSVTSGYKSDFAYFHIGLNRVRILAKNATTRQLLKYGPAIVAYDMAYIAYAALSDRTAAPLRGRLKGLREWRHYRRRNGSALDPSQLAPIGGIRLALERRRACTDSSGGMRHQPAVSMTSSQPSVKGRGT